MALQGLPAYRTGVYNLILHAALFPSGGYCCGAYTAVTRGCVGSAGRTDEHEQWAEHGLTPTPSIPAIHPCVTVAIQGFNGVSHRGARPGIAGLLNRKPANVRGLTATEHGDSLRTLRPTQDTSPSEPSIFGARYHSARPTAAQMYWFWGARRLSGCWACRQARRPSALHRRTPAPLRRGWARGGYRRPHARARGECTRAVLITRCVCVQCVHNR